MKKESLDRRIEKLSRFSTAFVLVLCLFFVLYMFLSAITRTVVISPDSAGGDIVDIQYDNPFYNILLLVILGCILYLIYEFGQRIKTERVVMLLSAWTIIWGLGFVYSASRAPAGDAEIVANAAFLAAHGNINTIGEYFAAYPFRLGLAFYNEIVFRIVLFFVPDLNSSFSFLALQVLNVFWLLLGFLALIAMSQLLYHSDKVKKLTAMLLMMCLPIGLFCSSINGRIPSFTLTVIGICFFLAYMHDKKWHNAVGFGLFMGLALGLKLDVAIAALAIAILWIVELLNSRKLNEFAALIAALTIMSVIAISPLLIYAVRSDLNLENSGGISLRTAMGMNEKVTGSLKYDRLYGAMSDGTANNKVIITENEQASDEGRSFNQLIESVQIQWNDPSFRSVWENKSCNHYREPGILYRAILDKFEWQSNDIMNIMQNVLLAGTILALIGKLRNMDYRQLVLPLILLGGFLFYTLFPAKSQYALSYYMLMVPLAAYGLAELCSGYMTCKDKINTVQNK